MNWDYRRNNNFLRYNSQKEAENLQISFTASPVFTKRKFEILETYEYYWNLLTHHSDLDKIASQGRRLDLTPKSPEKSHRKTRSLEYCLFVDNNV